MSNKQKASESLFKSGRKRANTAEAVLSMCWSDTTCCQKKVCFVILS